MTIASSSHTVKALRPIFIKTPEAPHHPSEEMGLYDIFKATFTPSSISNFAITGGVIGYFYGQTFEMAAIGASVGCVKDFVPVLFSQLPEDVQELAKETANVGAWTLGTYALYNVMPNRLVRTLVKLVPTSIKNLPAAFASFASSPISNPRSLEAVFKTVASHVSSLAGIAFPSMKATLKVVGFGNFEKFVVAGTGSYLSLKSLESLGEHRLVKPFADIIKEFADDKAKFFDKLIHVGLAVSAIPLAKHLQSEAPMGPFQAPDLSLPFTSRIAPTLIYWAGKGLETIQTGSNWGRVFLVGSLATAHVLNNHYKPTVAEDDDSDDSEVTLDTIHEMLHAIKDDIKGLNPKTFLDSVGKLKGALKPLKEELTRAVSENNKPRQHDLRTEMLRKIDAEIQVLTGKLNGNPRPGAKAQMILYAQISDILDLKIEELKYKRNSLLIDNRRAAQVLQSRNDILDALNAKLNAQTALRDLVEDERVVATQASINCPDTDTANEITAKKAAPLMRLVNDIERIRTQIRDQMNRIAAGRDDMAIP